MSKKRFYKINIEISNICNLQCSFCPKVIRSKKLMDVALFEQVIRQVAPLTEMVCFHLMGEPLLHPKLDELLEICARYSTPVFFVSNGVLLSDKRSELLLHPVIRQVNFSLHSYLDNYPDKDPSEYLVRIFAFTDMALERRPDLYVNFRLWNLQDTIGKSSENVLIRERVEKHYGATLRTDPNVRVTKSQNLRGRLYVHYDTEFTWPSLDLPVIGSKGTCYGLRNHFGILADGTVVPCCLDKEGQIPLGRVGEAPIEAILSGERATHILKGFLSGMLQEDLCQRCDYMTRFTEKSTESVVQR
ncbi:MAG: radical SAM protein [Bdellovibrionales bacterium]|nr:radical SAM protein [Bdellovibrionales bacterium]